MIRWRVSGVVAALLVAGAAAAQTAPASPAQPGQSEEPVAVAPGAAEPADRVLSRLRSGVRKETTVNQSQAEAVTLTLGAAALRPVQTWVRTAGAIDAAGKVISADVPEPDSALIKVGQRVRAFPPSSKSSMYQAFVTRVTPRGHGVAVDVTLASGGRAGSSLYVTEIVVEQGPFLSVPNEAIIEEGDRHVVYVQHEGGQYVPQDVQTGIQGELYTQVLDGLRDGDQVVTFGSFFIDAEHKLKSTDQSSDAGTPDDHRNH